MVDHVDHCWLYFGAAPPCAICLPPHVFRASSRPNGKPDYTAFAMKPVTRIVLAFGSFQKGDCARDVKVVHSEFPKILGLTGYDVMPGSA